MSESKHVKVICAQCGETVDKLWDGLPEYGCLDNPCQFCGARGSFRRADSNDKVNNAERE